MLLVNGVPLAGWKKIGDRNDYSDGLAVFNDEQDRDLAMRIWQLVHSTAAVGDATLDVLDWMFEGNHYLTPVPDLREDPVAYAIRNPSWMAAREINVSNRICYAINNDNTLSRIKHIVSTAMGPDKYGRNQWHRTTVEMEDGAQREIETHLIVHTPLRDPS